MRLLSPVAMPSKILCLGMNFRAHTEEVGADGESVEPTVFSKLASSLTGPSDPIVLPAERPTAWTTRPSRGRHRPARTRHRRGGRLGSFAGYIVANDVTARDWQLKKPAGQWLLGKTFDTFLPIGPRSSRPMRCQRRMR